MRSFLISALLSMVLVSTLYAKEKPFDTGITQENVKTFMAENYLNLDASCLDVKKLNSGGNATESIFLVQAGETCNLKEKGYIVKSLKAKRIMANGKRVNNLEASNLDRLVRGKYFEDLPNNIKVILPEKIFTIGDKGGVMEYSTAIDSPKKSPIIQESDYPNNSYGNSENSNQYVMGNAYVGYNESGGNTANEYENFLDPEYIEVMKLAKGEEISKILLSLDSNFLHEAIKDYAHALALLHQKFMDRKTIPNDIADNEIKSYKDMKYFETMIHGDPHWGNVFYDAEKRIISFIDNESFTDSIDKKTTIIKDLDRLTFYATSHFGNCYDGRTKLYEAPLCQDSIPIAIEIIKEYIENYPLEQQEILKKYIFQSFQFLALHNPMKLHREAIAFLLEALPEILG